MDKKNERIFVNRIIAKFKLGKYTKTEFNNEFNSRINRYEFFELCELEDLLTEMMTDVNSEEILRCLGFVSSKIDTLNKVGR